MENFHDENTEILTEQGFKKFNEIANLNVACFNPENEQLEYHKPSFINSCEYDGNMYYFHNDKMDIKVNPNHKMWVSNKEYEYHGHRSLRKIKWSNWHAIEAKNINIHDHSKFRCQILWSGNDNITYVDVCEKQIPIELYLEFLGYLISEGCLYTDNKYNYTIGFCQTTNKYYKQMRECLKQFSIDMDIQFSEHIVKLSNKNAAHSDLWEGRIYNKDLFNHFKQEVAGEFGGIKCFEKKVPRWIMQLSPRLLNIFLKALVDGDGSCYENPNKNSNRWAYYTTSKQLSDDVYEIVYKCGYVPTLFAKIDNRIIKNTNNQRLPLYTVLWSSSNHGRFPLVYKTHNIEQYSGLVWELSVPTGLFITRRNGKITIQRSS